MTNEEREKEIRKQPIPSKEECVAFYKELIKIADVRFVPYYNMAIKALGQQLKTGRWIFHKPFENGRKNCNECIECSQCHIWLSYDYYAKTPYCPNCGADMRGDTE